MKNIYLYSVLLGLLSLMSCDPSKQNTPSNSDSEEVKSEAEEAREDSIALVAAYQAQSQIEHQLMANMETTPVAAGTSDDAADDPAFWYNESSPEQSVIFGTNKKSGLYAYSLQGEELGFYPLGKINNIDIRQGINYKGETVDILSGSNRSNNSIIVCEITKEGKLEQFMPDFIVDSTAIAEVYGYCMYKDAEGKAFYIVNGKSGVAHAYHYVEEEGQLNMTLWRSWTLGSQTEGMVADDELGHLYIGEENKGVWKIDLSDEDAQPALLNASQESSNPNIRYDVEGISLYKGEGQSGYLIVSSQGNFSYALFDRLSNAYLGSFSIKAANGIDGVEETDGLDICSLPLGSQYLRGVLIVQDGFNYDGDTLKSQNFKIIDNQQVLDLIESQLKES